MITSDGRIYSLVLVRISGNTYPQATLAQNTSEGMYSQIQNLDSTYAAAFNAIECQHILSVNDVIPSQLSVDTFHNPSLLQ